MGGRYGARSDGSSDYQSRQPTDDDLDDEQQTVADAVQSVADRHHDKSDGDDEDGHESDHDDSKSESSGTSQSGNDRNDTDGQHPLTAFGGQSRSGAQSGLDALADIDEGIADQIAKRLTERVQEAVEETDPDDKDN